MKCSRCGSSGLEEKLEKKVEAYKRRFWKEKAKTVRLLEEIKFLRRRLEARVATPRRNDEGVS